MQHGWLVFGVNNKTRKIVGSDYRNTEGLRTLKNEISQDTSGSMGFIDIYEVYPEVDEERKICLFPHSAIRPDGFYAIKKPARTRHKVTSDPDGCIHPVQRTFPKL